MKSTQNEKISQIKFETLVVGIDIGKETHYARAFDYRGIELARLLKFSNTDQGFQLFDQWMRDICKQQEKTEIIAGFEPLIPWGLRRHLLDLFYHLVNRRIFWIVPQLPGLWILFLPHHHKSLALPFQTIA
jgi:hypothetical protein